MRSSLSFFGSSASPKTDGRGRRPVPSVGPPGSSFEGGSRSMAGAVRYRKIAPIGSGGFSTVWQCEDLQGKGGGGAGGGTLNLVAVKEVDRITATMSDVSIASLWTERRVLKKLSALAVSGGNGGELQAQEEYHEEELQHRPRQDSDMLNLNENDEEVFLNEDAKEMTSYLYQKKNASPTRNTSPTLLQDQHYSSGPSPSLAGSDSSRPFVQLLETFATPTSVNFVLEVVDGGTLWDHIRHCMQKRRELGEENPHWCRSHADTELQRGIGKNTTVTGREQGPSCDLSWEFTLEKADYCCSQLASALAHLHRHHIVWRDVKLTNVMVRRGDPSSLGGREDTLVLIDFGFATDKDPLRCTKIAGTMRTMAPEVVFLSSTVDKEYYDGFRADVWSFGCCVHEIYSVGLPLLEGYMEDLEIDNYNYLRSLEKAKKNVEEQVQASCENKGPPASLSTTSYAAFWKFLAAVLRENPDERPASMVEVFSGNGGIHVLPLTTAREKQVDDNIISFTRDVGGIKDDQPLRRERFRYRPLGGSDSDDKPGGVRDPFDGW